MERPKRQWGDRQEARRIRDLDPVHQLMPYFLPKRCDAEVYMHEKVDVTNTLQYIKTQNELNPEHKMTLFHVVLAGMSKTIIHMPYLNRFISGKRFYERHEVSLSFVVKKQFTEKGEESLMILKTKEDTTLNEISRKVAEEVKGIRETGGNQLDRVLYFLVRFPRPVLILFTTLLNILEYYGKMPKFLWEMDPYYCTVLLANLGSIKIGAPYHHLNNYGTNSIMVTIGEIHKELIPDKDGSLHLRDIMEMGITIDERIGDGYYFAKSINMLKHLLQNPELLESPFKEEVN